MSYDFFAMMSRMKYIERWALMRNSITENISEHSLEVAMIAHALAVIGKVRLGKEVDPEHAAMLGMFHDCTEIITGDMPTPVKYYNHQIRSAYQEIEQNAANQLLDMLPEDLRPSYAQILLPEEENPLYLQYEKAADKLSALIKCIEEVKVGNGEFARAKETIEKAVHEMKLEEAEIFEAEFLQGYYKTLDDIGK